MNSRFWIYAQTKGATTQAQATQMLEGKELSSYEFMVFIQGAWTDYYKSHGLKRTPLAIDFMPEDIKQGFDKWLEEKYLSKKEQNVDIPKEHQWIKPGVKGAFNGMPVTFTTEVFRAGPGWVASCVADDGQEYTANVIRLTGTGHRSDSEILKAARAVLAKQKETALFMCQGAYETSSESLWEMVLEMEKALGAEV